MSEQNPQPITPVPFGSYVVVEGMEGVGKSTIATLMATKAYELGVLPMRLSQPGSTLVGSSVKRVLSEGHFLIHEDVKLRLLEAARLEAMLTGADFVRKAKQEGRVPVIIGDRHVASTWVLQVGLEGADGVEAELLQRKYQSILPVRKTFLLTCPAEVAFQRVHSRDEGDKKMFDLLPLDKFQEMERAYLQWSASSPEGEVTVIDASGTVSETWDQIRPIFTNICEELKNEQ